MQLSTLTFISQILLRATFTQTQHSRRSQRAPPAVTSDLPAGTWRYVNSIPLKGDTAARVRPRHGSPRLHVLTGGTEPGPWKCTWRQRHFGSLPFCCCCCCFFPSLLLVLLLVFFFLSVCFGLVWLLFFFFLPWDSRSPPQLNAVQTPDHPQPPAQRSSNPPPSPAAGARTPKMAEGSWCLRGHSLHRRNAAAPASAALLHARETRSSPRGSLSRCSPARRGQPASRPPPAAGGEVVRAARGQRTPPQPPRAARSAFSPSHGGGEGWGGVEAPHSPSTHSSSTLVSRLAARSPTANAPNISRPTTRNLPQFFWM